MSRRGRQRRRGRVKVANVARIPKFARFGSLPADDVRSNNARWHNMTHLSFSFSLPDDSLRPRNTRRVSSSIPCATHCYACTKAASRYSRRLYLQRKWPQKTIAFQERLYRNIIPRKIICLYYLLHPSKFLYFLAKCRIILAKYLHTKVTRCRRRSPSVEGLIIISDKRCHGTFCNVRSINNLVELIK